MLSQGNLELVISPNFSPTKFSPSSKMESSDDSDDHMTLPRFVCNALYVTDLDPDFVSDDILFHLFGQVGDVLSVKLCPYTKSAGGLSYADITYGTVEEACIAWRTLNSKQLNGIPMRILFSNFDEETVDEALFCSSASDSNVDENEPQQVSATLAFKARAAKLIQDARDAIIAQKKQSIPHIDPYYVPSSEPWTPQPWSAETLKANLARAHLPEERRAMLGSTLLPLVWTCTEEFASLVTDELVKSTDIQEIVNLMESTKALQTKVQAITEMILKRIRDQPPFVPKFALAPGISKLAPSARELAPSTPKLADQKAPTFRKGTGFFDVSKSQQFNSYL